MEHTTITAALRVWAAKHGITVGIDDAVTLTTRTVSETAASLTTERLCVLAAYTDTWHVFCFTEQTVWSKDLCGDPGKPTSVRFDLLHEK